MAVTLTFKKTKAKLGAIVLDASVSETHTAEVEITEHPVERGANIVDHKRPKPDAVTIEGLVSNTPLPEPSDALVQQTQGNVTFDSASRLQATRASTAYQDLLDLKDSETLFTLVTALRTYEDMAIKTLTVPRDARSGQTLRFSAQCVQVRTVSNRTVKVVPKATKKVDVGKKATTPMSETEKRQSTMKKLGDTKAGDTVLKFLGAR